MHEMSIAQYIVDIALAALPSGPAAVEVEAINLEVGRLTAVVPTSLRRCFEIISQGTALAGATLRIDEIGVVVGCRDCRAESEQQGFPFVCPDCESRNVDLICGRELLVTSIEIADEPKKEAPWKSRS